MQSDDKAFLEWIKEVFGDSFQDILVELGYEASNKGVGWLHIYIDEQGKFQMMVPESENIIPIWLDKRKRILDKVIRFYEVDTNTGNQRIRKVEVWEQDDVTHYILENGSLTLDFNKSYENGLDKIAHFKQDKVWSAWGRVPFIAFYNNRIGLPDLQFIKTLLDAYDDSRSETANYVEEVKNLIYVLKGYGGEDLTQFMQDLNHRRAIVIDDVEHGGVDALTPSMDITAAREHYEQLKRDLVEDGQSINKDLDRFGSAPSGVALKFMYAGLDLKCNLLEREFKKGFEELLDFVCDYLHIKNNAVQKSQISIVFNRDMEINETEVITNCVNSIGVVSKETVVANHPWVKDVELEMENLAKEEAAGSPDWDEVKDDE